MTAALAVAGLHLPPARADGGPDLAPATAAIEAAVAEGARLVLLPELFAWPCFTGEAPGDWRPVAETLAGPTVAWAVALADRLETALLVPLALAEGDAVFNAAVLVRPGRAPVVAARKIHLPPASPGDAFGEADHFTPGPAEVACFDLDGFRIASFICFDRRFPESWRAARAAGADLVLCPVNGPADEPEDFFLCELRTHARENGVYALTAGRSGIEHLHGRAIAHKAPTALVAPDGGAIACLPSSAGPGHVIHTLTRDGLRRLRASSPFERRRAIAGAVIC